LKNEKVANVTLVDLDPKVVEIAKTEKNLLALNEKSLLNPKVKIFTEDAFQFIINTKEKFDFIIADFPDPRDTFIAKLYSREFYT
jgi:probable spermidine synthase